MEKQSESASSTGLLGDEQPKTQSHRGKHKLSICSKICYAIGGAPYQITGCALGFFLQIYLLDVVQMSPFHASIILFTGRVWDAITDPLVGFFVSKSSWTRFGRLLPWIIFSTPFALIAYFFIWFVPGFSSGQVMWCLVFYCLFQTLVTCFHVPYSALTMFISKEQSDRDSATGYRMTVEVLGTVLGTAIQGQIVGKAGAICVQSLQNPPENSSVSFEDVNGAYGLESLTSTRQAYMIAAGVICAIYMVCAIILTLGVREERDSGELLSDQPISFWQGLKLVMSHGPYIKLIAGFLFTSLAFMLLEGNFALFLSYTLNFPKDFQNILLVVMVSATLTVPFWQWFLTRFGKKTAVYFGISSVIPFLIVAGVVEINLIVTYIVAVAAGLSVAAAFLLPWSMLPDVIDDFTLKYPDSPGHEAIFFSFYVFFTKFASGVSLGISTLGLHFAGYRTRGCSQPEEVNVTLKLLVCAAPILLILVGLLLFKLYPINEEKRRENKKALQLIRDNDRDSDSDSIELASNV
ncbi:sodium-dependent lysophosphatidylcholine symporter 1 [Pseudophryne corroboree]|uniref:sodium-dependent lysophosphatidylcholine symporter 1 n=1 Tax=Pseudophryne corroboree TaxID=495146 RepID=UPI003081803F